jgi:NADPH-dependent 2,4-dienoyl-CoA reductase/sulfur reductase-like enzyme
MNVLVIGGVAGGASAAARLRRLDEDANITIIERTGFVSYANCGLPYYVGGVITDRRKLTLQTPQSFRDRFNIDVRVSQEALSINRDKKTVAIRRLGDGSTYEEPYDYLILSPGARAFVPDLPGFDSSEVYTLKTVEDALALHDAVDAEARSAVVIGAGFIGLEAAENLRERGLDVTVLQRPDHALPTVDADMAAYIHTTLRENGVDLRLRADVTAIRHEGGKSYVEWRDRATGKREADIQADIVVLAIGVLPESELAEAAGLELGVKKAIVVDEHMVTSDPSILAVGDAVQVINAVSGQPANIALAGPANKQGRIAASTIAGLDQSYKGTQGASVIKVFDLTVASTGLTEKAAKGAGLDFDYTITNSASHATYYPDSRSMTLKMLFEKPSGRVLGAQIAGYEGVDKRLDVLATAIGAGMTVYDLADLELSYAPPFSSAKDPVNFAGFVAQNVLDGLVDQVHWDRALAPGENEVVLDVRTDKEWDGGHLVGALHIPVDELRERLGELPREKRLLVHCRTGLRSYIACRILKQKGFDCANISGGYLFLETVQKGTPAPKEGRGPCGL